VARAEEDLVRAASAAFGRGDLGALRDQFFAADIVWHIAGTGPLAGDYHGVAQVMELLAKVSELSDGKATEVWTQSSDPAAAAEFWS